MLEVTVMPFTLLLTLLPVFAPQQAAGVFSTAVDEDTIQAARQRSQNLFSLTIAAIAEAILMRTSAEQAPSLHMVAPRDLKLFTSSNFGRPCQHLH